MPDRIDSSAITVREVATRAGVSPMTVSRTLAGGKNVRPELQERVWQAVTELGYRRNENARSLRPGQASGLIGVAITNLANPYYGQFALGVEEAAAEFGRRILLGNSGEDPERERRLVADFVGRQVEGLIVVPAADDQAEHLRPEVLHGTPVVLASRLVTGLEADAVVLDDEGGARSATESLLADGHRRIGYLGNVPGAFTEGRRYAGFRAALAAAGVAEDEHLVRRGQSDVAQARGAMRELLEGAQRPTAVFAANNRTAIGALTAIADWLREGGAGAPALASFDDFDLAALSPVPLTVVDHDARELGRRAARLLLGDREAGADGPRVVTLDVRIRRVVPGEGRPAA